MFAILCEGGFDTVVESSTGHYFTKHSSEKKQLGENARRYYEQHFTRERFMATLEAELRRCAGQENDA